MTVGDFCVGLLVFIYVLIFFDLFRIIDCLFVLSCIYFCCCLLLLLIVSVVVFGPLLRSRVEDGL